MNPDEIKTRLVNYLAEIREWLLVDAAGKSFSLKNDEIEIVLEREKLLFSFQSNQGFQTWRLISCHLEKQKIYLELSRNFGTERAKIELIPRASASETNRAVELARIDKTEKIARLLSENFAELKLVRVSLKDEDGRLAYFLLEDRKGIQTIALADVSETISPERLLTTAILEFEKFSQKRKKPVAAIGVLAAKNIARRLQKILALLDEKYRMRIEIFEFSLNQSEEENLRLKKLARPAFTDFQREKPSKISIAQNNPVSVTAREIIALAPESIDVVAAGHGETLRFNGLAFARIRKVAGAEKIWFGIENDKQILGEKNFSEFLELIENLKTYRRHDSPNKRHDFYKLAPEAWLETALRRDIARLDANIILSPVYNQFRAGRDKIDLLALRRDGRVVILELKTSPDREMIFQSLDYWRKIEIERRAGNLQKAKFFGEAKIKNETALIYLVAPMLDFHPEFSFLAKTVAPEIEIYRFDLSQNWRENLRVVRQEKS